MYGLLYLIIIWGKITENACSFFANKNIIKRIGKLKIQDNGILCLIL